jgi:hypothetical protein
MDMTQDMADVFAAKDEPPSPPSQRAEPRSAPVPAPAAELPAAALTPAPVRDFVVADERPRRKTDTTRGISTTVAIPELVMERIHERLAQEKKHNMRSLILYALSQIGIEVEPEHLTPTRRRLSR